MKKPIRPVGQSRIPGPLWAKIRAVGKKANRSGTQQVVVFCKEGIEREKAKK